HLAAWTEVHLLAIRRKLVCFTNLVQHKRQFSPMFMAPEGQGSRNPSIAATNSVWSSLNMADIVAYCWRNHCATEAGQNRTEVPTRKLVIRPALASLKIETRETFNIRAKSSAVNA